MINPPPLPTDYPLATKDQRIRAGLIDHFIDSSVWFWFFILLGWSAFHLKTSVDARSLLIIIYQNFPISMTIIVMYVVLDFMLCIYLGQSIGQCVNHIYKSNLPSRNPLILSHLFDISKIWLHGLFSRCVGLPLLCVSLLIWLILNPIMIPIHLYDFSLIEPKGSLLLLLFLLKIIAWTLFLFALFIPFGIGFIRGSLPTWYDRLLGVQILNRRG